MLNKDKIPVSESEPFKNDATCLSVNTWVTAAAAAVCSACALWNRLQMVVETDDEASNEHAGTESINMLHATDMGKSQREDVQSMQKRSH